MLKHPYDEGDFRCLHSKEQIYRGWVVGNSIGTEAM